jgi:hypothetical protein
MRNDLQLAASNKNLMNKEAKQIKKLLAVSALAALAAQ